MKLRDLCERKWYLQKVARLPEPPFSAGARGDALHTLCGAYLTGTDEPETTNVDEWRTGLDMVDQDILGRAFREMVASGVLVREPNTVVEKAFQVPILDNRRVSLTGFADAVVRAPNVLKIVDHKSSSGSRWFATEKDLAENPEMLAYAGAFLRDEEVVVLRHNQITLDPLTPTAGVTEVTLTRDDVRRHWETVVVPTAKAMLARKLQKLDATEWAKIPGPAVPKKACHAYNRPCHFYDICYNDLPPDDYIARSQVQM
jgi:hypothetical protein